jgi:hypothetical protein
MTTTAEPQQPAALDPDDGAGTGACVHCGAPLEPDQEWCLECGAARTVVHRPPDWRIPLAIVATVVLLVLIGFLIALVNLSGVADQRPLPGTATTLRHQPRAGSATTSRSIASWPVGLPGWTVELVSLSSEAAARAAAGRLAASGIPVGVLDSSSHPAIAPGSWIVFSGRYPTQAAAQAQATSLVARGQAQARTLLVGLPGR